MSDNPNRNDPSNADDVAPAPAEESLAARIAASVSPRVRPPARAEDEAAAEDEAPEDEAPEGAADDTAEDKPAVSSVTRPALFASSSYPGPNTPAETSTREADPADLTPIVEPEPSLEDTIERVDAPALAPRIPAAAPTSAVPTPAVSTPAVPTPAVSAPTSVAAPLFFEEMRAADSDSDPTPAPRHIAAASVTLIPRRRRSRRGIMAGIIGGSAAVVVAAAGVAVIVGATGATSANAGTAGAVVVVEDYLSAIARSDSASALEFLATAPTDPALLTDEVLRASNSAALLQDITVGNPVESASGAKVTASFRLGSDRVKHTFPLNKDANGDWRLAAGTFTVPVDRFPGLALALNGIPVAEGTVELFPGRYTLATTTPNFMLSGRTTVVAGGSEAKPAFAARAQLDDGGIALFRETVRSGVERCLASTALAAGCGLQVPDQTPDGSRIVDGTVKRTLSADGRAKLAVLRPVVSQDSTLLIAADTEVDGIMVSMECVNRGQVGSCSTTTPLSLGTPLVDFSSSPPTLGWGMVDSDSADSDSADSDGEGQ